MEEKFCISVVVDGKYEKYIPYFILFIINSNPNAFIKIFFLEKLSTLTSQLIDKLNIKKNISVEENFFSDFPKSNQQLKSIRWLIPRSHFNEFDYIYMGDVDMLICETVLDIHKKHATKNQNFYSNSIRDNQKRFTGLHFFEVSPYYDEIEDIITKKRKEIRLGKINFKNYRNEHLLYDIIKESKLSLPKKENRIDINGIGPHHGIHLGLWRKGGLHDGVRTEKKKIQEEFMIKDNYLTHYNFFKSIRKSDEFDLLYKKLPIVEIENMERYFLKKFNL